MRKARLAAGLCMNCGKEKPADKSTCAACRGAFLDYRKRIYAEKKARGICVTAGCKRKASKRKTDGKRATLCRTCARVKYQRRRAA